MYTCQCYSLDSSHPLLPPMCPQVSSLLHPYCCPPKKVHQYRSLFERKQGKVGKNLKEDGLNCGFPWIFKNSICINTYHLKVKEENDHFEKGQARDKIPLSEKFKSSVTLCCSLELLSLSWQRARRKEVKLFPHSRTQALSQKSILYFCKSQIPCLLFQCSVQFNTSFIFFIVLYIGLHKYLILRIPEDIEVPQAYFPLYLRTTDNNIWVFLFYPIMRTLNLKLHAALSCCISGSL